MITRRILVLPFVLLALLLQAGAGTAAARAQADAANPFGAIPICSADKTKAGRDAPSPSGHAQHQCGACVVCIALHPPLIAAAAGFTPSVMDTADAPAIAPSIRPRGPPRGSANARAPPALA